MTKKLLLVAAFAAAGLLGGRANATMVLSTVSVQGVQIVSTNTSCGACGTIIKAFRLCNDTQANPGANTCVKIRDSNATNQLVLCAAQQACSDSPHDAAPSNQARNNSLQNYAGEVFTSTMSLTVVGSTASANIFLQTFYDQPIR